MSDEQAKLLRQIAADVAAIKAAMVASVGGQASALGVSTGGGGSSVGGGGGESASDAELDDKYGDPDIRRDPPRWDGESYAGRRFSEATPEYLDSFANFKEWQAKKDDEGGAVDGKGRPKSHWARKDARLARGWAARLRSGWKPGGAAGAQKPVTDEDYGDAFDGGYGGGGDSDIPFAFDATNHGSWERP